MLEYKLNEFIRLGANKDYYGGAPKVDEVIFQGAMNALNPVRTMGDQIAEAIGQHIPSTPPDAIDQWVIELLDLVGITAQHKDHFPHQYSGGMRWRAMIAMALSCNPQIVAVMYLGGIVEFGMMKDVLKDPQHPYTKALLSVIPVPNPRLRKKRIILEGETPNPIELPAGCRFHPRCPVAMEVSSSHKAACLLLVK